MKIKKLLVLAGTAVMLMACGGNNSKTPATSSEPVVSSEATSSEAVTPSSDAPASSAAASSQAASSSTPASSSAAPSSSAATSSSSTQQADRYEVNYRNTMQGADKTKVGERVQTYTNSETFDGFVTALTNEGSCQVASVEDSVKGTFTTVQVGSSSGEGALTFTFSVTVKSVILSLENYNKSYENNGTPGTSQDTSSKLYVNSDSNLIDLSATAGNPVTKVETVEINSKTLKLYNKAGKNRVFVNAITFVL